MNFKKYTTTRLTNTGSDTSSSNECDTSNSIGSDTTEAKLNISSIGSYTRSSNECDTSNSIGSDTIEAKLNTSSNGIDTSNSNVSDTTSSIATDTLIKQYKNKKEIYIRIFDKWNEKNIDNYSEIYHSKFYYSYLWDLKNFLVKPNGISKFIPEGYLCKNYLNIKKSQRLSFL